jgi:ABC-type nitrate/sulfonate/bicarbonate transport system ATPase subunit
MNLLHTEHITKKYLGQPIIEDINISLDPGEIVCLLGVSGSGKSTLFHVMSGILEPDAGKVFLEGRDITGQAGHISYMQQKDLLLPYKTILDNVALPLILRGERKDVARAQALKHFQQFGLQGTQTQYPSQLSGGMRQRAALLRTHLFSGAVALLDEPFSALDAITKRAIHRWYLGLIDTLGMSTIFITHDIDEAILLSDRIYIMTGIPGRIDHELAIEPPRPRPDNFSTSEQFMHYKRDILQLLHL